MSVFKRGNRWWYTFKQDGIRIQESTGSKSKEIAVRAERQRRNELDEARNSLKARRIPILFRDASKEWMEASRARWGKANVAIQGYNLRHLNQAFGEVLLTAINHQNIHRTSC